VLVSLNGDDLVRSLGLINVAVGIVCLAGWQVIGRLRLAKEVPDIAGAPGLVRSGE